MVVIVTKPDSNLGSASGAWLRAVKHSRLSGSVLGSRAVPGKQGGQGTGERGRAWGEGYGTPEGRYAVRVGMIATSLDLRVTQT